MLGAGLPPWLPRQAALWIRDCAAVPVQRVMVGAIPGRWENGQRASENAVSTGHGRLAPILVGRRTLYVFSVLLVVRI